MFLALDKQCLLVVAEDFALISEHEETLLVVPLQASTRLIRRVASGVCSPSSCSAASSTHGHKIFERRLRGMCGCLVFGWLLQVHQQQLVRCFDAPLIVYFHSSRDSDALQTVAPSMRTKLLPLLPADPQLNSQIGETEK